MNSKIQVRLLTALSACLRPLVRILLRSGISYHQFDEVAKRAFVNESLVSDEPSTRRTNVSRIAVRTGMSRKEVARIRDLIEAPNFESIGLSERKFHTGQAARVLQIWHTDPRFLGGDGHPLDLSFDSGERSFGGLVRFVGGDVPAGAVRAELIAAGAVEEIPDGRIRVLKRYFIPGDLSEEIVVGFSQIVAPLLAGLAHNSNSPKQDAFLQRVAYSDSVVPEVALRFRQFATTQAEEFVQTVDDWLTVNESPQFDGAKASNPRVGVGVFYFEQPETNDK
jgi:hypothetical protein